MDLTIRNAKLQDIGFVLSGIREIFKIENDIFVYNEKKKLVSNAIRDKHIRVVMKGVGQ